jgi:hypothetical protein
MRHPYVRWAIIAATFFLLEINDMSNHAISFEGAQIGAAPEGWTKVLALGPFDADRTNAAK